jgi:lipoprotein-anchoring transpeptidase ErfK/SrfK
MLKSRHLFLAAISLALTPAAGPAWAKATVDLATLAAAPETMTPGQYVWNDTQPDSEAPLTVTVDLTNQLAWVYRGEVLIGLSTISAGAPGYETPTGSYTILQKNVTHKSNLYDDAPMPFMQRLTWDGIALHAGSIPGHPASHGCVRLPKGFAKLLYGATKLGTTVTITGESPMLDTDTVEVIEAMSDEQEAGVKQVSLPYDLTQR